jgi:hypothetical protein
LPPETRLSWIASLLPYMGHADWHQKLERGNSWNSPQNLAVVRQPLGEVINPAFGASTTPAGFPVTHYVGVAGVGEKAGRLPLDHPQAGVFGYGRSARPQDIADGTANTIAVLGVRDGLGPWAAGGQPTVRPLTQPPYVNGPDGFGSGQPDGMLAGMADGAVRFISKDVDPRVIEQLATIRGQEATSVAALTPKAGPAVEPLKPPEPPDPEPPVVPDPKPFAVDPPAEPAKPSPATQADVVRRLEMKLPSLELTDVGLGRALGAVGAMCNVAVALDPDAMQELGVAVSDPVSVELSGATAGKALAAVAAARGLVCLPGEGFVLVTSPAAHRETLRSWDHSVSDLAVTPAAGDELLSFVMQFVAPESWQPAGGRGTLKLEDGKLTMAQTEAVYQRVVFFLEKLRAARNKPRQTQIDPESLALGTRLSRARSMLSRPLTANFRAGAPLARVLAYLEESGQCNLLADWPALAARDISSQSPVVLSIEKRTLGEALGELAKPLGLALRALDAETIELSTPKALAGKLEVEFYPVAAQATSGRDLAELLGRVRNGLPAGAWREGGGAGVVQYDGPSQCLIVLQTQAAHAAIERLLAAAGR